MRGATLYSGANARGVNISIHVPHARSDDVLALDCRPACDFNPRSSCEERHQDGATGYDIFLFQSTLLMRGATSVQPGRSRVHSNFNPRSSCEERLQIGHVARHVDIKCIFRAEILFVADSHTQRIVIVFMQDFVRTQHDVSPLRKAIPSRCRALIQPA